MGREQPLNEKLYSHLAVLATSEALRTKTPLWDARERLIQAFDREAESRGGE